MQNSSRWETSFDRWMKHEGVGKARGSLYSIFLEAAKRKISECGVCVRVYLVQIALEGGKQTLVKRKVKVCVCLCIIFCIKKRSKILRSKSPHTATAALLN